MVFIDSDQCIAAFLEFCRLYDPTITSKTHEKIWKVMAEHADTCFRPEYTPLMPEAPNLLAMLKKPGCFVLTALTNPEHLKPYCADPRRAVEMHRQNKIDFYAAHGVGREKVIVVNDSRDKSSFAVGGNVLIDDFKRNIDDWVAAGGIGILVNPSEQPEDITKINGIICL